MSGYFPQRTFNGVPGEASVDLGGPDELEKNLDDINAMFNPDATHTDGSPGGLTKDNLADGEFDASNIDVDPITGVTGSDLQTVLESEKTLIDQNASAIADRYTKAEVNAIINSLPRLSSASNPNLLDNSWFLVNSRGITSGAANNKYYIDRWLCTYGSAQGTWSWDGNGITITGNTGGAFLTQKLSAGLIASIYNKQITASIMLSDGTIISGTVIKKGYDGQEIFKNTDLWLLFNPADTFAIRVNSGKTITIRAVKLELGSTSTLANDAMPDYNTERMRCIASKANPADPVTNKVIGTAPNPNLLDNPWFGGGYRINQRGIVTLPTGTEAKYFIDRWKCLRVAGMMTSQGISFAWDGVNGSNGNINQICLVDYRTNTLTASVNIDGTIHSFSFYFNVTASHTFTINGSNYTLQVDTADLGADGKRTRVTLITNATTPVIIYAIKLEKGAVSTLINDVPPHYATELAKCQRFLVALNSLMAIARVTSTTNTLQVAIPIPVSMRSGTANVTVVDYGKIICEGQYVSVTAIANNTATVRNAGLDLNVTVGVNFTQRAIGVWQEYDILVSREL